MRAKLFLTILFSAFLAEAHANNAQRQASSIFSTPSSTTSASSSSTSPALVFEDLTTDTLQTCTPYTFTWIYESPTLPLMLTVSNLSVPAGMPDPSSGTPSATSTDKRRATATFSPLPTSTIFDEDITNKIDPYSGSFTWTEINVPEGWYYLYGVIQSAAYVQQSDLFYVENGADTSCVLFGGGSSTTTSAAFFTRTGTVSSATVSSPSSSSREGTIIPSSGSSSSSNTAIVDVVMCMLIIVDVIIAILVIRRCKLRGATLREGGGGSGGARYVHSRRGIVVGAVAGAAGAARRCQLTPPSVIPDDHRKLLSQEELVANKGFAQNTGATNDPFDDSMRLEVVQGSRGPITGSGAGSMSRTYSYGTSISVSHSNYDSLAPSGSTPSVPDSFILPPWARRASMSTDGSSSSTYPPPAYPSGSSAALSGGGVGMIITTQQPVYRYDPHNDIGSSANNNRSSASSIGGHQPAVVAGAVLKAAQSGSTDARKTARKPVPAYTYDDLEATSAGETSNIDDIPPGLITFSESNFGYDNNAPAGVVGQTLTQGHYMTRMDNQPGVNTAKDGPAELLHKKSFGEKPLLDVLIPDSVLLDTN